MGGVDSPKRKENASAPISHHEKDSMRRALRSTLPTLGSNYILITSPCTRRRYASSEIGAILTTGIGSMAFPLKWCGAGDAQGVGWRPSAPMPDETAVGHEPTAYLVSSFHRAAWYTKRKERSKVFTANSLAIASCCFRAILRLARNNPSTHLVRLCKRYPTQ